MRFRAAVNHKVSWTSDMDDQPIWNWVIDGVNGHSQIPGPCTCVDYSRNLKSVLVSPFNGDHRSIKPSRRPQPADLLFHKHPAFRDTNGMKPQPVWNGVFKMLETYKRDPIFHRMTFFTEKARLICDAQKCIQFFG
jgi:hypothetical protein